MTVTVEQTTGRTTVENGALEAKRKNVLAIGNFFTEEQFARLQKLMYAKRVEAGSHLFWEGEPADKLYYIQSGRVKLKKVMEDGKELILSIMQAGDLLCEPDEGLGEVKYCYSAEAIEDARLGVIQWKDLEILLYRHGDFAIRFMNWIARSRRVAESKFRDLLLFGKPGALASTLIRLSNSYGVMIADGIKINLKLTNSELASFIGTTRESVNRMLAGFRDDGTIDVRKGFIVVQDLSALRAICQCPSCPGCSQEICCI